MHGHCWQDITKAKTKRRIGVDLKLDQGTNYDPQKFIIYFTTIKNPPQRVAAYDDIGAV